MPITIGASQINIKSDSSYIPVGLLHDVASTTSYISPEYYGAVGDGETDDTAAWQSAINSGLNVVALNKKYKCGQINVSKNTTIDCNGAEFICTGTKLFNASGSVTATLTGESNYSANQVGYTISDSTYSDYTGFAMLQGTNNFSEGRTYYYGGFACSFENGAMLGSYPVDVESTTILIINPITVTIRNVGDITYSGSSTSNKEWFYITYGLNCVIENFKTNVTDFYYVIGLRKCIGCICKNLNIIAETGTTGTNSYIIGLLDSSFCFVKDSYLYNKYWHCITTGGNYLCFHNTIGNCVLLNDTGIAYSDHGNSAETIIIGCTACGIGIGSLGIIRDVSILSMQDTYKNCAILIGGSTDQRLSGVDISNVRFYPDDDCQLCGIYDKVYPQVTGKTFYVDNIKVQNVDVKSDTVTGSFWFGFWNDTSGDANYVVKNLLFNSCNLTIDLSCTSSYADLTNMVAKKATYETIS